MAEDVRHRNHGADHERGTPASTESGASALTAACEAARYEGVGVEAARAEERYILNLIDRAAQARSAELDERLVRYELIGALKNIKKLGRVAMADIDLLLTIATKENRT